jgi:hypothetical protein
MLLFATSIVALVSYLFRAESGKLDGRFAFYVLGCRCSELLGLLATDHGFHFLCFACHVLQSAARR